MPHVGSFLPLRAWILKICLVFGFGHPRSLQMDVGAAEIDRRGFL